MSDRLRGMYEIRAGPELRERTYSMAQVQRETGTRASLRIVFDNTMVSVPLVAATTFGDLARTVRGMSAKHHSHAAAIAVIFTDDRDAGRRASEQAYELPHLTSIENEMRQTNCQACI